MGTAYRNAPSNGTRGGLRQAAALLLCLVAASVWTEERFASGLLWRIEAPGGAASYLFGTMHSDDPRVLELAGPVERAFETAAALTLEAVLDAPALASIATGMFMTDGGTLRSLLAPEVFDRAVEAMAGHGIAKPLVANMKPWAVAVTLMTPPARSGVVLDQLLYQRALADGKPVDGLETVSEQLALFDAMDLAEQIALLEDTLDHLADIDRMLETLRAAWLRRDLAQLMRINAEAMRDGDPQLAADFNRRLITERNHRMAKRLEPRLREGGRFIAVGALHLPGEEGLLALLSRRGYRLTRVY